MRSLNAVSRTRPTALLLILQSLLFLPATNSSYADQISQTGTFSSGSFGGDHPEPYEVTPFDHTLGSLKEVHITISGVLNARIGAILSEKHYNVGVGLNFVRPPNVLPFFQFEGDGAVFSYTGKSPPPPKPLGEFLFVPLTLPSAQVYVNFSFSRDRERAGFPSGVLNAYTVTFDSDKLPGWGTPVSTAAAAPTAIIGGTINFSDYLLLQNDLYPVVTEVFGKTAGPAQGKFSGTITIVYDYIPASTEPPDADSDGIPDIDDNCPISPNPDQTDNDMDGAGDACDEDDDNDSVPDNLDNCPLVANANQSDLDSDGSGDVCDGDADGDGWPNDADNCPNAANADQTDTDLDGVGDECDSDDDNDGVVDSGDNCPTVVNPNQNDLDGDQIGDACDADLDNDGVENSMDNCPIDSNASQDDTDSDGAGDVCDADDDNDGIGDAIDNCPLIVNPNQSDFDQDGRGDVCDSDLDGDGVANETDNCPNVANSSQSDFDGDGIGDSCDTDIDGDGVTNNDDACPATAVGELVHPDNGCSVAQLCPCSGPRGTVLLWNNHGKYVSCVAHASEEFVEIGLISDDQKDVLVSAAGGSACGKN